MKCAFGCQRLLQRKRASLECETCNATIVCCVDCVRLHTMCLPCIPVVRIKTETQKIQDIVDNAREFGYCFSDYNYEDLTSEPWLKLSKGISVALITVYLGMGGSHNDDQTCIRDFRDISIFSKHNILIDGLEIKLRDWAIDFEFDKEDLMHELTYEPQSLNWGNWFGLYGIVVYTFDQEPK